MEFNLRFLEPQSRTYLQHAIDGVNKAAMIYDPGAWNFISAGHLIQANYDRGYKKASEMDPIAVTVFDEMEQDGHSGHTASWVIRALTEVAKNYRKWRTTILVASLERMKKNLNAFLDRRFTEKFPEDDPEDQGANVTTKHSRVLHDLEHSYLVKYVLDTQDRTILEFLLKMEDVSHLGNEVLLDQIEGQLKVL